MQLSFCGQTISFNFIDFYSIKCNKIIHQSIVLEGIYRKSFESNSIRWSVRPQIHEIWNDTHGGAHSRSNLVDLRPNASSNQRAIKSKSVELFKGYRTV